ncbi:MAG: hypothetical protein ABIJ56_19975 [Pseudomonadota bacterium]
MLEDWMSAAAFAEANEPEKALELAQLFPEERRSLSLEDMAAAVAFAEANEHDAAREVLGVSVEASGPGAHAGLLGIPGIRVWFGTVAAEEQADPLLGVRVWCGTVSA